ncbi:hypothetical protein AMS68_005118 [Peltaster fructicola]|uniref:Ras-GEF domain-containing protein n=1 Tax=Peltaster fructicola TaxID=286661 RepID=A0A6H0XY58_9PEZI|nr:hypothetical protein AMS68_005118 [Peltaster fructicola]
MSASAHSPARHIRNKSSALAAQSMTPPTSSKTRADSERSSSQLGRKSVDDETRHFVGNVGSGGTLYLAPSRLPHQVNVFPATPPDTAHGESSGPWTPRAVPPLSLANTAWRWRPRSRSVSTIKEKTVEEPERSRSSLDVTDGLLNLRIPHYRLGTPQFGERGTAYLHSSIYTDSDDDRSSVLSQSAYDRLFPLPPSGNTISQRRPSPHHLHPSAARPFRPSPSPLSTPTQDEPVSVFDRLATNPNDPAVVQFSPQGQVLAATVPRLIVQITSPRFLDYELLSDFFLTYRGFVKSHELLDWLMTRMRWAINNISDAGRIVRVRTFVALRHWILNYFSDDFAPSLNLRQQFCEYVNGLATELRQGGAVGDLNIMGELKKCWRRTSALFWPHPDAIDSPVLEDIIPGGIVSPVLSTADGNLYRNIQQAVLGAANHTLTTQLVAIDQRTNQKARVASVSSAGSAMLFNQGGIPASPLSDSSLQVLSCSVPFLRRVQPDSLAEQRAQQSAPRPVMPRRQNSLTRQRHAQPQHRRTESDTVLTRRTPEHASLVDIEKIPSITLTGGLIRGLLLQPSPAVLQRHAPRSPPLEGREQDYFDDASHISVKRFVGDMRRALSVKKSTSEASDRSHHSASSGSRGSNRLRDEHPPRSVPSESSTSSGPRKDVLAAKLQKSYDKHFITSPVQPQGDYLNRLPVPQGQAKARSASPRHASDVTTRSRSIVIVDATSIPVAPVRSGGDVQSTIIMPLFPGILDAQRSSQAPTPSAVPSRNDSASGASSRQPQSIDGRLHGSFIFPPPTRAASDVGAHVRTTSDVHGVQSAETRAIPQLRRRPGGDLKAADHVHELANKDDMPSPTDSFAITVPSSGRSSARQKPHKKTSSAHPRVRSSFRSEAERLAKVRAESHGSGGIEDTLARLEGKPRHQRHSGMSWLDLPTNEESADDQEPKGTDFEMMNPGLTIGGPQIYRVSRVDLSEEGSYPSSKPGYSTLQEPIGSQGDRASSPVDFDKHAVYIMPDSDNEPGRKTDRTSAAFTIQSSFLLDDNQSLSDISTDIAEDPDDDSAGVRSFFFDDLADENVSFKVSRPLFTAEPIGEVTSKSRKVQPLKVATSAAKILGVPAGSLLPDVLQTRSRRKRTDEEGHYPFILAFESQVIAEQLCIIEKDALDEIDWKDLITLNWQHAPSRIRNWAEYLKLEESNGIDLIVARFNLMVKWVVSECVLTESMIERARCITKYIHIATHCLRLRNYASMAQITLALLSSDLARLVKTWSFVLPADKRMLDQLELLCQPLRNFHNLRTEMETASLAEGCIPFIGLYTHDLMYNAQKPAMIQSIPYSDEAPSLINFERHQTAATITKSLLRLLDASARYIFRPHPEALSRCLWLAALDDIDISEISMELE